MVAARSASQVADVDVASELGPLLYLYCSLTNPRWRLEAVLRVHALTRRLAIVVPRLDRERAALLAKATCPEALRGPLSDLAIRSDGVSCSSIASALYARDWLGAARLGITAALELGDIAAARAVRTRVQAASRIQPRVLDTLIEWGYARRGVRPQPFVASLARRGVEEQFRPSASLVIALVDEICASAQRERAAAARALVARVPRGERGVARAHLCRLTLAFVGAEAADREARAIREKSHRHTALRLLAPSVTRRSEEGLCFLGDAIARIVQRLTPLSLPRVLTPGASELERALYDEGVALSDAASRRRRVIVDAARATVRRALRQPERVARDILDARLRTLVHLGGQLASDAVANAITQSPISAYTERVLETLLDLDATRGTAYVLAHATELAHVVHLLYVAERCGGVPEGFAYAYSRAFERTKDHGVLRRFMDAWRAHRHMEPDARAMHWLAQQDPSDPVALICSLDDEIAGTHVDHLRTVIGDLDRELLARPPRVWSQMKPWSDWKWRNHLEAARDHVVVNPAIVERCAKWLRLRPERLAIGDLGLPCTTLGIDGVTYRVRLLDKRHDLLTYLRFADVPVPSCYRSSARTWTWSGRDTIDAWGDPLTLCFHVERGSGNVFEACGFLFGSFAEVDGRRSVVFNSLHVRPNTAALRFAILENVERQLRALGIGLLGIANVHNGRGELPRDYEERVVELVRFRALRCPDIGDDICCEVNERTSASSMYWRNLDR